MQDFFHQQCDGNLRLTTNHHCPLIRPYQGLISWVGGGIGGFPVDSCDMISIFHCRIRSEKFATNNSTSNMCGPNSNHLICWQVTATVIHTNGDFMIHKTKGIGFPKCFFRWKLFVSGSVVFVLIGGVTATEARKETGLTFHWILFGS